MKYRLLLPILLSATAAVASDKDKPVPPPPLPATVDGLPIGAIPKQELPAKGCAAFLWSNGPSHALVAMVTADPAQLRVSLSGTITDVARSEQKGAGGFGFAGVTEYRNAELTATLDMTIAPASDLSGGAAVPTATLRLDRPGQDSYVAPVAGLIGCA